MCCGNGGGGGGGAGRVNTQQRRRLNTHTRAGAGGDATYKVTLPDGTERGGLTEHQALVLTLEQGGGMEPETTT